MTQLTPTPTAARLRDMTTAQQPDQVLQTLQDLASEERLQTLLELPAVALAALLDGLGDERVARLVASLAPDDAARILLRLSRVRCTSVRVAVDDERRSRHNSNPRLVR